MITELVPEAKPGYLFQSYMSLSPYTEINSRRTYDILMLFADLGGLVELFIAIFAFVLGPITYHSYIIDAAEKMFHVRTSDTTFQR